MEIGFMQGRLCDRVDGKIQAFPWRDWESEFFTAQRLGLRLMEWTLDHERLHENPLLTESGQNRIRNLMQQTGVRIASLTGDCFMQAPFYKVRGDERETLLRELRAVLDASSQIGISHVLIPLVDNGALISQEQENDLIEGLLPLRLGLAKEGMKIVFESDFPARRLALFMKNFPADAFGINYDIGNSAALGYLAQEEIGCYGDRIVNVHVKDRILHGTTVPLGSGNADFPAVFKSLRRAGYVGNFILQTARAEDGDHAGAIARYRSMSIEWWRESES
jgi:hexulose-6-phosphate isomerase